MWRCGLIYKVVLVDDEERIVNGLKQVVDWEKYNCEVVATAYDAKSGTLAVREHNPDILFTDIRMPGIDGLTMLAGLKSEFSNMQVTVLTGHRDFDYAKRAINMGVTRYLIKPSKMHELDEALLAMTEILDKAKEMPNLEENEAEENKVDASEASSFIVNSALRYIETRYAEKISLSDVADKIFVSQWYLSKLLNKSTGKTFYDLVNSARINKAKELLKDPSLKVHEISEMVGFNDVAHFSRVFKRLESMTPKEYRNGFGT